MKSLGRLLFFIAVAAFVSSSIAYADAGRRSFFGVAPVKRGAFFVCPSGAAINFDDGSLSKVSVLHHNYDNPALSIYKGRWFANTRLDPRKLTGVIYGEIIIGKSVNNYSSDQIRAILDKLLTSHPGVSSSYRLVHAQPIAPIVRNTSPTAKPAQGRGWVLKFMNSSQKTISVQPDSSNVYGLLKDASGQEIKFSNKYTGAGNLEYVHTRGALYCTDKDDQIRLRLVESLPLMVENQFGEPIKTPLIIMISDLFLRAKNSDNRVQPDL